MVRPWAPFLDKPLSTEDRRRIRQRAEENEIKITVTKLNPTTGKKSVTPGALSIFLLCIDMTSFVVKIIYDIDHYIL